MNKPISANCEELSAPKRRETMRIQGVVDSLLDFFTKQTQCSHSDLQAAICEFGLDGGLIRIDPSEDENTALATYRINGKQYNLDVLVS